MVSKWFIEVQYLVSSTKLTAIRDVSRFLWIIKEPIWIKDLNFRIMFHELKTIFWLIKMCKWIMFAMTSAYKLLQNENSRTMWFTTAKTWKVLWLIQTFTICILQASDASQKKKVRTTFVSLFYLSSLHTGPPLSRSSRHLPPSRSVHTILINIISFVKKAGLQIESQKN